MNLDNDPGAGPSSDRNVACCMCVEEYARKESFVEHMRYVHNVSESKIEFMYQFSTTVTYDRKGIFWPQGQITKNFGKKRKSVCVNESDKRIRASTASDTLNTLTDSSSEANIDRDIGPSDSASMIGQSSSVKQADIGGGGQVRTLTLRVAGSDTSSIRSLLITGSGSVSTSTSSGSGSTSESSFNPGSKRYEGVESREFVLRTERQQTYRSIGIKNPLIVLEGGGGHSGHVCVLTSYWSKKYFFLF